MPAVIFGGNYALDTRNPTCPKPGGFLYADLDLCFFLHSQTPVHRLAHLPAVTSGSTLCHVALLLVPSPGATGRHVASCDICATRPQTEVGPDATDSTHLKRPTTSPPFPPPSPRVSSTQCPTAALCRRRHAQALLEASKSTLAATFGCARDLERRLNATVAKAAAIECLALFPFHEPGQWYLSPDQPRNRWSLEVGPAHVPPTWAPRRCACRSRARLPVVHRLDDTVLDPFVPGGSIGRSVRSGFYSLLKLVLIHEQCMAREDSCHVCMHA